jgi:pimeloyl-ACP methyl ester carboxylesterase
MRVIRGVFQSFCVVLLLLTCCALSAQNEAPRVRNIVLVHGAWADGSGWKGVYDILVKDGYNVSIVQELETSFKDDVAATKRVLAQQDGQCILVAHSYGGAVITEAGTDPSVAGLVYIAAHMPDAGENEADDGKRFPSDRSKSTAIKKTADGFTYLDPPQFHDYFAADLSAEQAAFMARSQVLNAADNFKAVITTRPIGFNAFWLRGTPNTLGILQDLGFIYHIDDTSRDEPFTVTVNGKPFAVVPYTIRNNDIVRFDSPATTNAIYLQDVKDDFGFLYAEAASRRRMMSISAHDRISGIPGRVKLLEDFIRYAQKQKGVVVMRKDGIAKWALSTSDVPHES